jgi:hypothetical protein
MAQSLLLAGVRRINQSLPAGVLRRNLHQATSQLMFHRRVNKQQLNRKLVSRVDLPGQLNVQLTMKKRKVSGGFNASIKHHS